MKRLFITIAVSLLLGTAFAQTEETQAAVPPTLTLEHALSTAPEADADVLTARADLSAAERDLSRAEGDPLSLRLERVETEQAVEAAQETLDAALLAARTEVSEAYFTALEAEDALSTAQTRRDITATTLEATGVKYNAGAATQLELASAENDLAAAERELSDALAERDLTLGNLGSLLATEVSVLAPVTEEVSDEMPELETVLSEARSQNTGLKTAARAVELAQVRLEAVDNAFSARAEIDAARDTLESAQTSLADTQRALEVSVQQSYNALLAAQSRYASTLDAYETTAQDLAAQRARLEGGSISPLAFQQAELSLEESAASLHSAFYDLRLAALTLEGVVLGQ